MTGIEKRKRVFRIFLSSTFRDFQAERDEMVKTVLPHLQQVLAQRGIAMAWADLRWGVTNDMTESFQTIKVCLTEVKRSDLVIGMLGERYGWHITNDGGDADKALSENFKVASENFPWVMDYQDRSVTELELIQTMKDKQPCFVYIRDPKNIPPDMEKEYSEFSDYSKQKLGQLKEELKQKNMVKLEGYIGAKRIAERLLSDLSTYIEQKYPISKTLTPLESEREIHDDAAEYLSSIHTERISQTKNLEDMVFKEKKNVLVVGEEGVGKSAFVAHSYLIWREKFDSEQYFLLSHFFFESNSAAKMISRVMGELKEYFKMDYGVPAKYDTLRDMFPEVLKQVGLKALTMSKQIIFVFDSLDLCDKNDWMPTFPPDGISFVFSLPKGSSWYKKCADQLKCVSIELPRLEPTLKVSVIEQHLDHYSKKMSNDQVEELKKADQTGLPSFLVALLNELNIVGRYDTLLDQIKDFLKSKDVSSLYERILVRLEKEHNIPERPNLVGDIFGIIHVSRSGLSENEICDILNIPMARFSPIRLATSSWFVGEVHLHFSSKPLEEAIFQKYVSKEEKRLRQLLIKYNEGLEKTNPRRLEELPYQYQKLKNWKDLHDLIFDLDVFPIYSKDFLLDMVDSHQILASQFPIGENVIKKFDAFAKSHEPPKTYEIGMMLVKYMTIYHNNNKDNGGLIEHVYNFCLDKFGMYHVNTSKILLENVMFVEERLMDYKRAYKMMDQLMEIKSNLQPVLLDDVILGYLFLCGDACFYEEYEQWLAKLKESKEPIDESTKGTWDYRPFSEAIFEAIVALKHRGDYELAEKKLAYCMEILRSVPPCYRLGSVINWTGQLRRRQGRLEEARSLFEKALTNRLLYFGPNHAEVIKILENIALVRLQIDPNDTEAPKLRKQAYDFRKKMDDWSYCMCCDTYIDFKSYEEDLKKINEAMGVSDAERTSTCKCSIL